MRCPSCDSPNLVQIETNKYQCPYCGKTIDADSATLTSSDSKNNEAETDEIIDDTSGEVNNTNGLLYLISWGFYIIAVIDFCGMFFDYDFTGVSWSPIAFGVIGSIFDYYAKNKDQEQENN